MQSVDLQSDLDDRCCPPPPLIPPPLTNADPRVGCNHRDTRSSSRDAEEDDEDERLQNEREVAEEKQRIQQALARLVSVSPKTKMPSLLGSV